MAAADEGIEIPIRVKGAEEAVAALGRTNVKLGDMAKNANKLGADFGKLGGATSKISAGLLTMSEQAGGAGGAFAKMIQVSSGLFTAIGTGPVGLATALGGLAISFALSGKAAASATERIHSFNAAIDEQIAKTRQAVAERERYNKIMAGGGSGEERSAALSAALKEVGEIRGRGVLESLGESPMVTQRRLKTLEARIAMLQAPVLGGGQETIIEEGSILRPGDAGFDAAAAAAGRGGSGRGGGGGGKRPVDNTELFARQDAQLESMLRSGSGRGDADSSRMASDLMMFEGRGSDQGGLDQFISQSARGGIGDGKIDAASRGVKSSAADQMVRDAERVKDAWGDAYSTMQGGAEATFAALITGNAGAAKAALAATGDRMVADGTHKLFEGAAALVLGQPSGAALLGIGAGEIAFGTGLGAAMKGGGGGGGGGGARPTPGAGGGGDRRHEDRGPTVINVYSMNPTAETGRAIDRSMRAAARKRGN